MSPAARITIDPEDVRGLATRMRGGAFIFANSGRSLAQISLPPMPASLAAHVSEAICDANAALQDLAVELVEDAVQLEARASWAELGGGAETAWLIPGLRRYPSLPTVPTTPVAEPTAVTEEQISASQAWAKELLDGMDGADGPSGQEMDRDVIDTVEAHADQIPIKPLGDFSLASGVAPVGDEHLLEVGLGLDSGALGTGLGILHSSPTGWGIVGCLLAGGLVGSSGGSLEE